MGPCVHGSRVNNKRVSSEVTTLFLRPGCTVTGISLLIQCLVFADFWKGTRAAHEVWNTLTWKSVICCLGVVGTGGGGWQLNPRVGPFALRAFSGMGEPLNLLHFSQLRTQQWLSSCVSYLITGHVPELSGQCCFCRTDLEGRTTQSCEWQEVLKRILHVWPSVRPKSSSASFVKPFLHPHLSFF